MTVIATDGKVIAADSRTCSGDLVLNDATRKLVRCKDGSVAGVAGEATSCALVREWLVAGEDMSAIPDHPRHPDEEGGSRFKALILRPGGRLQFMDAAFTAIDAQPPFAIGSGGDVALGAMLAGKSAEQAVKIAMRSVTSCGGSLCYMKPKRKP